MKKYSINDFYVGELFFPCDDIVFANQNYQRLLQHGAIDFRSSDECYHYDTKRDKFYYSVLTMFYRKSSNGYVCMHNGEKYSHDGVCYYRNLVPLKQFLPKIDYDCPKAFTFRNSIMLFSYLFHQNNVYSDYRSFYNIKNFFVGNLNLYKGIYDMNSLSDKYIYYNVPQSCSTFYSDAKLLGGFAVEKKFSNTVKRYDYEIYKCIYMCLRNGELYNINNYQVYTNGCLDNSNFYHFQIGDSFYDQMIPLNDLLKEKNIEHQKKIRLSKVLYFQRKLNQMNCTYDLK